MTYCKLLKTFNYRIMKNHFNKKTVYVELIELCEDFEDVYYKVYLSNDTIITTENEDDYEEGEVIPNIY